MNRRRLSSRSYVVVGANERRLYSQARKKYLNIYCRKNHESIKNYIMKWTQDPNRQIFVDDTKARVKSHETRELRLAMKSENEIQTGNVMKAKFFVCYHVTVL